uniref:Insulinase family protein n=1 Tax=Anaerolinea thermolimosa TaxID=229919 RepID=A0A7C4KLD7_9CHLR
MKYETFELPNGMRLIHKRCYSPIAHCGLLINVGSRDEREEEHGLAHLIEHVVFKGTKKRRAFHVLSRLEDVGGELNAFTSKEDTCITAAFLKEYYERSLELLSDILCNSSFPEKEIQKEKGVILDEINSCKDNPAELIYDEFEKIIFKGNPLARPILGTPSKIRRFTRKDIKHFIKQHYSPEKIVLSSVGDIPFSTLKEMFIKYFSSYSGQNHKPRREPFTHYKPSVHHFNKGTHQAHCIIGNIAYSHFDPKKNILFLLNNILGGPCLNSRLSMTLRERNGLTYDIESGYTPYSDTGVFSIYFNTDRNNLEKTIELIKKEMTRLKTKKLGEMQLARAKKQLTGQLAIAWESCETQMLNIGKSFLIHDHIDSMKEIIRKIESITSKQLLEIANEILDEKHLSQIVFY